MPRPPKKIDPFDVCLGAVVASKRKKQKLSQSALGSAAGIPLSNMQRREEGSISITVAELERMSIPLKVSAAKLVEEALDDYGGLDKLLAAAVSVPERSVDEEDNVTYLGRVTPPLQAAADEKPRVPPKD